MRISLIHATWPVTPFGATWYKLAEFARAAGLKEALAADGHQVEEHTLTASGPAAAELRGAFELSGAIAERCRAAVAQGALPVIVCGSCGVSAMGAMAGLSGAGRTGVLWLDAHPDLNTPETSGSGLFDGMALAAALGLCWTPMGRQIAGLPMAPARASDVCLFGARDIDPGEAALIAEHGIPVAADADEAVRHLTGCERVYIHLDMDVHDARRMRTNNVAVPGGPGVEEVGALLAGASARLPVGALALTGLDPAAPDAELAIRAAIAHIRAICQNRKPA